jgi:hypothetical protein
MREGQLVVAERYAAPLRAVFLQVHTLAFSPVPLLLG